MRYRCPFCGYWRADPTIINEWDAVIPPPAPELKSIYVDPKSTALLILDMENSICNKHRCVASIPRIKSLLNKARQAGMSVVYSLTRTGNIADINQHLSPYTTDPIVKSNVDKFYETNLEDILRKHHIQNVIITGYAANGAVLHTAVAAAFRGYQVAVPVDGMSAAHLYPEQYTAWHLLHSPGSRDQAVLTRTDLISISSEPSNHVK
ncbi:isochorismatase [Paenibacillus sp. 79R4]|uniref:cysteine hydrolase n=1 Tax=Paenibacillus sp. 79R4 TaxID=2212847 RepID=UPI0015BA9EEF|nr:cysteine hydrolase [Paenibacillus sp. 79R4]NWL86068.1 isochorismatase [Paenibacillus sp. 79R4]